jgi:hypothetical protein
MSDPISTSPRPGNEELLEQLARIAATLFGIVPDSDARIMHGGRVIYEGPAWGQPRFLNAAHNAMRALMPKIDQGNGRLSDSGLVRAYAAAKENGPRADAIDAEMERRGIKS